MKHSTPSNTSQSRSTELAPGYADPLSNWCLLMVGRPEVAAETCRRAVRLSPHHANAWANLGIALQAQSDLPGAALQIISGLGPIEQGAAGVLHI